MSQKNKNIVAIVQARMQSERFPGKVLAKIDGKIMLDFLVDRLINARSLDGIMVATSIEDADDVIAGYCKIKGINCYRGSECDVLSRFYHAAKIYNVDIIVRICADSPLIDPEIIDTLVADFIGSFPECDYFSNTLNQSYPLGMNAEVFSFRALEYSYNNAGEYYQREHVTPYIYEHQNLFAVKEKHYYKNLGNIRLTVDTPEDLEVIRCICESILTKDKNANLDEILKFLEQNPSLLKINAHVEQRKI
jgi:spore coat polysaccharide biosynthesis protein SpsF